MTALGASGSLAGAAATGRPPASQPSSATPPAGWPGPVYDNTPAGQLGGTSKAMVIADGRAWMGYGPRLAELDISDPTKPHLLRTSAVLADVVSAVATDGSHVYVAAGRTVYVFPVEGGLIPLGTAGFAHPFLKLVHAGGFLYGLTGDRPYLLSDATTGLVALDVRDPSAMRLAGALKTDALFVDLAEQSGTLFVTSRLTNPVSGSGYDYTLTTFSLEDPAVPKVVSTLRDSAMGLVATSAEAPGRLAAVAGSLAVFDVSDPQAIHLIERLSDSTYLGFVSNLLMMGDGIPAYSGSHSWIAVGRVPERGGTDTVYRGGGPAAGAFATDGALLYRSELSGRLAVVDPSVNDPPAPMGMLDLMGYVSGVSVDPARPSVVVAAIYAGGVRTINETDLEDMYVIGSVYDQWSRGKTVARNEFIAAANHGESDHPGSSVDIFELGPELSVRLVAELKNHGTPNFALAPPWLYTLEGWPETSLVAWDLKHEPPEKTLEMPLAGFATDLAVDGAEVTVGRYARPVWWQSPMQPVIDVIDLTDPTTPQVRTISLPELEAGVPERGLPLISRVGDLVYLVATSGSGPRTLAYRMYVVDVSPPRARVASSTYLPGKPTGMTLADGYALVGIQCAPSELGCGYAVLDLANPRTPRPAGWLEAHHGNEQWGSEEALPNVVRGRVYVADGTSGLMVYEPDIPWRFGEPVATYTAMPMPSATDTPEPSSTPTPTRTAMWMVHLPVVGVQADD